MQIALFVVMMATGQLLFKATSNGLATSQKTNVAPIAVFLDWKLLLALALYGAATLLWIHILRTRPLSTAYPLSMGATIALTSLIGIGVFHESLTTAKAVGILLVIVAMYALSR